MGTTDRSKLMGGSKFQSLGSRLKYECLEEFFMEWLCGRPCPAFAKAFLVEVATINGFPTFS